MITWINSISQTVVELVGIVKNSIMSFVQFVAMIPKYLTFASRATEQLPAIIVPFAILAVYIMVFRFTIDR